MVFNVFQFNPQWPWIHNELHISCIWYPIATNDGSIGIYLSAPFHICACHTVWIGPVPYTGVCKASPWELVLCCMFTITTKAYKSNRVDFLLHIVCICHKVSKYVHAILFGSVLYPGLVWVRIYPLDRYCAVCSPSQPSLPSRTGSIFFTRSFVYVTRFLISLVLSNLKHWSSCYGHEPSPQGFQWVGVNGNSHISLINPCLAAGPQHIDCYYFFLSYNTTFVGYFYLYGRLATWNMPLTPLQDAVSMHMESHNSLCCTFLAAIQYLVESYFKVAHVGMRFVP